AGRYCMLVIGREITQRKKTEEALRESERRLQESQRTGRIGHEEFNVVTGGLLWSDTVFELYERDIDLGPPSYDEVMALHSPEDAARLEEAVKNAVATGEGYAVDLKVILPSGRCGYHHAIGTPETEETGRVVRITGTVQDVTDRKLAEESYQNIATELEEILNSLPDAVVYADNQRIIRKVNPAFTRIFGYKPEEVIGKTTRIIYRNDEEYLEQGKLRYNPLACQKWEPYEIHHVRKDGTVFITETVGTPVRNARGEVVGLLGVVRDVSAQRQMQERIRHMEKMESVGRLAGGVAHDFNNMLNVILGHTEMALEKLDAMDPLRADLEEVRKAGQRSANLTKQLLAFARKQTVAPRVIDLNETISSALSMLERLIGETIELHWKPGKDLPPVNIDPGQVDQMLTNLAINARDAIGHRHGRICIETSTASYGEDHCESNPGYSPGSYVMLSVNDDGCGMDRETSSHIFEPFYTTKESEQGTGLGLATVYGIVIQNGGFINVTSEKGQGATFRICLPVSSQGKPSSPRTISEETAARGSETILVVEDEPSILKMVTMMLKMEGYTVMPAGSPGEAIRLAREHSGDIHLLVSDVVMPEMNGRDLARNIISLHPNVKRLFMSGYTADVIAHQGVLNDGVNFLQKPFSKMELTASIRRVLDGE
ncbi:MAG TPA: PAS domain S-box protein, partial [Candidatus Sabulitectum sp.]|nr:PAS domain S-box protein [Candidatus Sabulitectum sp.]